MKFDRAFKAKIKTYCNRFGKNKTAMYKVLCIELEQYLSFVRPYGELSLETIELIAYWTENQQLTDTTRKEKK